MGGCGFGTTGAAPGRKGRPTHFPGGWTGGIGRLLGGHVAGAIGPRSGLRRPMPGENTRKFGCPGGPPTRRLGTARAGAVGQTGQGCAQESRKKHGTATGPFGSGNFGAIVSISPEMSGWSRFAPRAVWNRWLPNDRAGRYDGAALTTFRMRVRDVKRSAIQGLGISRTLICECPSTSALST